MTLHLRPGVLDLEEGFFFVLRLSFMGLVPYHLKVSTIVCMEGIIYRFFLSFAIL